MARLFVRLNLFALYCLLLETKSATGHIVTQKNISLQWINDFLLQLSSSECQNYTVSNAEGTEEKVQFPCNRTIVMGGNFVNLTLTKCNGTESPPVHIVLHYPELVKEVKCYQTSLQSTICSWIPNTHNQDLKFFYVFVTEYEIEDESRFIQLSFQVKECPSYILTNSIKTGCHLEFLGTHIFLSFRGSKKRAPINTFRIPVASNVRLPALMWNVTKTKDKFHITWKYPEISTDWKIRINYTQCNDLKFKDIQENVSSAVLDKVSYCPYHLAIIATSIKGNTLWTEYKYFEADTDRFPYMYAAIFFPLMCAGLAAIILIGFMRNKDIILPKIPEPRNLLSGIPDNNFKFTLDSLYPTSKDKLCIISLVRDNIMKPPKQPLLCNQPNLVLQ